MAKQVGPVFFTGTIDGFIFYKLGDHYYTRAKGSYKSARHMRRNPKYKRTMQKADQFGSASKLTQEVYYRYLPKEVRKQGLFGKLTGMVNGWLQQGKGREEVMELLIAHCQTLAPVTAPAMPAMKVVKSSSTTTKAQPATPVAMHMLANGSAAPRVKKARYLSHWKVKRNGRLHIPKPIASVDQFASEPFKGTILPNKRPFYKKNE